MPYQQIDADKLKTYPLNSRKSKSKIEDIAIDPDSSPPSIDSELHESIEEIAKRILKAKKKTLLLCLLLVLTL